LNAIKTGLTGRTVLLPADDAEAYRRHIASYENEYKPAGLRECELVQSLADTQWRLNRIPALEMAIYAQGRVEFEGDFEEHCVHLRAGMIELQTHFKYEKQLKNLQIREARLLRRYQKEMAELRQLQRDRLARDEQETEVGFEFSKSPNAQTANHEPPLETTLPAAGGWASARAEALAPPR